VLAGAASAGSAELFTVPASASAEVVSAPPSVPASAFSPSTEYGTYG
jgi:hypothetical protein